jgi:DtxR family Mn-dependent transcriptional regulator
LHLHESGEMYLETILILSKKNAAVRSVDISEYMGVTKPSVSRAIGILKRGGYVSVDADGFLLLTESGAQIANKMYERHQFLTQYLMSLGVDAEIAVADACKIEHDISDESFQALKKQAERISD